MEPFSLMSLKPFCSNSLTNSLNRICCIRFFSEARRAGSKVQMMGGGAAAERQI
jgi:hypothetical protein